VRPCASCPEQAKFLVSIAHKLREARLACARHLAGTVRELVEADDRDRPANVRVL
jgi:hypothetical protein